MPNIIPPQFTPSGVPRRYSTANGNNRCGDVRQDNTAPQRDRIASDQPASLKNMMRSQQTNTIPHRSQKQSSSKRKTVPIQVWVKPVVKTELHRIAEQKGLSISATGAAFLEHSLQQNLHTQHSALLDPIIDKAIGKHMRSYSNRLAVLLVRSVFATEQIRSIVTNILSRQDGMTQQNLAKIITASDNKARGNITRITPQLKTFIEAVQKQLEEGVNANV